MFHVSCATVTYSPLVPYHPQPSSQWLYVFCLLPSAPVVGNTLLFSLDQTCSTRTGARGMLSSRSHFVAHLPALCHNAISDTCPEQIANFFSCWLSVIKCATFAKNSKRVRVREREEQGEVDRFSLTRSTERIAPTSAERAEFKPDAVFWSEIDGAVTRKVVWLHLSFGTCFETTLRGGVSWLKARLGQARWLGWQFRCVTTSVVHGSRVRVGFVWRIVELNNGED